jgi:hypothetical protein
MKSIILDVYFHAMFIVRKSQQIWVRGTEYVIFTLSGKGGLEEQRSIMSLRESRYVVSNYQEQTELNEVSHLKKKDMFELAEIMWHEPCAFKKRYQNPDEGCNARTQNELFEELWEVCVLCKKKENWTSAESPWS